ncbi:MAG: carboxymuconolactone decarboxylase family protein [Pseudomonadota bacterium]
MARIGMTDAERNDPRVQEAFAFVKGNWDEIPALYDALGAAPGMLKAWIDFAWTLRLEAKTDRALRELIILRGAQVAGAVYEWAHHLDMALEAGVGQAKLDALKTWRGSDLFSPAERAALAMAEEVAEGPGASAETLEALKARFTQEQVAELVLTASFYVCVARVLTSLGVEVEPSYQAAAAAFDP